MSGFGWIVGALALALLVWSAQRSRALFVLTVRDGKTKVVRGKPPHALLQDLADVFARAAVKSAEIKVVRDGAKPRLVARGLDEHAMQRARNVLGAFPAHKLLGSGG